MYVLRRHIRQHRDHSQTSQRQKRNDLVVVAGIEVDVSVAQVHDLRHIADIAGSLLDPRDVFHIFYQMGHSLRLDRTSGTAGYIVENGRDLRLIGDPCIMGDQSVLRRLIIIRSHKEQPFRPCRCRLFGELHCRSGAVGTGPRNDRDPVVHALDRKLDHVHVLLLA